MTTIADIMEKNLDHMDQASAYFIILMMLDYCKDIAEDNNLPETNEILIEIERKTAQEYNKILHKDLGE